MLECWNLKRNSKILMRLQQKSIVNAVFPTVNKICRNMKKQFVIMVEFRKISVVNM